MKTQSIGVIVPPANPTVEIEFRRLIPLAVNLYVTRLPIIQGDLEQRLAAYVDELPQTTQTLDGLQLEMVLAACTGSSYPLGAEGDEALAKECGAALGGIDAATSAGALIQVLRRLRVEQLVLLSPYPEWLTDRSVAFWRSAGFGIQHVVKVPGSGKIYDLDGSAVHQKLISVLGDVNMQANTAVVILGTGAPSLQALDELAPNAPIPMMSSNLASAWVSLESLSGGNLLIEHSVSPALRRLHQWIAEA